MGRLGPLTSLALGRSPYDDVVEGTGEEDPHEPEKQCDPTGRIVNPETKKLNKDNIRAHNEVMLVIGVAEPENGGTNAAELELARQHAEYESDTGTWLLHTGRILLMTGIWGLDGVRQRILVYKTPAGLPFLQLMQRHYQGRSHSSLGFAGAPSYIFGRALHVLQGHMRRNDWRGFCCRSLLVYVRFHLQLFISLQRLDLISSSRWLPDLRFFIPFSSTSPLLAPPPLVAMNASSISQWLSSLAIRLAPYAAYYLAGRIWDFTAYPTRKRVLSYLPRPSSNPDGLSLLGSSLRPATAVVNSYPESPTLGAADQEIRHGAQPEADVPSTPMALDGPVNGEPMSLGAIRRQSTFSSRAGEDWATDEEDTETINPTLISFDVDTSESPDPPTGVWSAELRPSYAGDSRLNLPREPPKYVVNPLTSLPSTLAGEIISDTLTHLLISPFEALALRGLARAFASKFDIPFDDVLAVDLRDGLSWRLATNILNIEALKFILSTEVWTVVAVLSQWLHVTDEEWKQLHREEAESEARNTGLSASS
ncbi:hypothetical protein F5Y15DRAFT_330333 [Xylariaceae sp. FL0016]|nr:hypothetical protein F5Y15DRAFT_330333 [Xylariaceae sp. FL0016]